MLDNENEFNGIIVTVRQLATAENHEALLDILNHSNISIQQTGYDNWNGGQYFYTVYLQLDIDQFVKVRDNLERWEKLLEENFSLPVRHLEDEFISRVLISPKSSLTSKPETNPHRPLSAAEQKKKTLLSAYLDKISEDTLIDEILLPLLRHLGFHRITVAGHKDKALEYGKDIWMKFVLPTQHVLYFGIQVKKGKLDSAGVSKGTNSNMAEIHNQALMMLGHEIFDPEIGKRVLVDHAFIVAGGEITKAARQWLAGKLDASKRSQIIFMDREDILNLYSVNNMPLPQDAIAKNEPEADDLPF
jgi:hypothetical protein